MLNSAQKIPAEFKQNAQFWRSWLQNPLITGAVSPSGKALARTMASYLDVNSNGPVIEIGPGTGPVTEALIKHGIAEDRLILLEYSSDFCTLLRKKFPRATIIQGDGYALRQILAQQLHKPAAAIVSSLPLLTKPQEQRLTLLDEAFSLMKDNAPFIQFTYSTISPMPITEASHFSAKVSPRIWLNMPPARVWVYTKNAAPQ